MSEQKNTRLNWLEKLADFLPGRIEAVQAELEGIEQALEENGIEHKDVLDAAELPGIITALSDDAKTLVAAAKSLSETYRAERLKASFTVDDVADLVIAMMKEVENVPAAEQRDKITTLLAEALGDDTAEIEMSLLPLVDATGEADDADDNAAELSTDLQEQMTDDLAALADGMAEFTETGKALKGVPDAIEVLGQRLEKVERQLRQRPRASKSADTEIDNDSEIAKELRKQMTPTQKFMGLEVYPDVESAMAARLNGDEEDYGL